MEAINSIDPGVLNSLNAAQSQLTRGTGDELRDNFMTMLVTQLQNQDPLNPLENNELTSQLAQINTVSGIDSLNVTLQGINSQIEAGQTLQAADLIGKGVLVPGDRLLVGDDGSSTPFGMELEAFASQVKVQIIDGSGQVVSHLDLGPQQQGVTSFTWDGSLDSGEQAPGGSYRVLIDATSNDTKIASQPLNFAQVTGISTGTSEGLRLDLGGIAKPVGLEDIRQIF
ncbi:MAG: flagellar hook assembly protein FlgD [Pseudomonadales bacterium]|nr:flagellar hook assembly protein FlgD [Pseudomonadales bacterium]